MTDCTTSLTSRRALLRATAVLPLAVGPAALAVTSADAAAPAARQPSAATVPPPGYARVLTASGRVIEVPRELGASLVGGPAPAGSRVTISFDRRLYTVDPDGPAATPTGAGSTATLTVPAAGAARTAGQGPRLRVGTFRVPRYPDDLLADPVPFRVRVTRPDGTPVLDAALSRERVLATSPWGLALGAGWAASGTWSWPELTTVRSVGPGPAPAGWVVRWYLGPGATITGSPVTASTGGAVVPGRTSVTNSADGRVLEWRAANPLAAGSRADLVLNTAAVPRSSRPGDPVAIEVVPGALDEAQRITGAEILLGPRLP